MTNKTKTPSRRRPKAAFKEREFLDRVVDSDMNFETAINSIQLSKIVHRESAQQLRITVRCAIGKRGTQLVTQHAGGDNRDRTGNLRLAKPALSQLSYIPKSSMRSKPFETGLMMVGLGRFELPTSRLSGVRSNQLSYRPGNCLRRPGKLQARCRIECLKTREESSDDPTASTSGLRDRVVQPDRQEK